MLDKKKNTLELNSGDHEKAFWQRIISRINEVTSNKLNMYMYLIFSNFLKSYKDEIGAI